MCQKDNVNKELVNIASVKLSSPVAEAQAGFANERRNFREDTVPFGS